jgi:hypothetical protein
MLSSKVTPRNYCTMTGSRPPILVVRCELI